MQRITHSSLRSPRHLLQTGPTSQRRRKQARRRRLCARRSSFVSGQRSLTSAYPFLLRLSVDNALRPWTASLPYTTSAKDTGTRISHRAFTGHSDIQRSGGCASRRTFDDPRSLLSSPVPSKLHPLGLSPPQLHSSTKSSDVHDLPPHHSAVGYHKRGPPQSRMIEAALDACT